MGILGAIFGLIIGVGLAYYITITLVKRSNDVGDSSGILQDFGHLKMLQAADDLRSPDYNSGEGKKTLKKNAGLS
ncbi:MAG: hypothetical protein K6F44_02550 [Lachnospiraceae bacterium]|nr:hypothetical protein [Lachnospiraceae bacterium]